MILKRDHYYEMGFKSYKEYNVNCEAHKKNTPLIGGVNKGFYNHFLKILKFTHYNFDYHQHIN